MAELSSEELEKIVKEEDNSIKPMKEFESPEKLYQELIASVRKYHPSTDISLIEKAYNIAYEAHKGQVRKSGEPYIIHPLCVAIILAELELDKETIVAGLLHDVVEDTVMTDEEIKQEFGAGEDGVKKMRVLSGGEKVRVLLSRMMIMGSNVLMFDEPTDHLDMESITALNNGMIKFPGVILFACRDHQVVQTTANRIIEFLPNGTMIDKITTYDEYLESDEMARKRQVYSMSSDDESDN